MNKNKLLQYASLIAALLVTSLSVSLAQEQALSGQTVNLFVHGLAFLLAITLVVGSIYFGAKRL